jgi:hypothetical protein
MGAEGINHNRVMMVLEALAAGSGHVDGDMLVVDKKQFGGYDICKPLTKARLMLNKFMDMGFKIEELDNKKSPVFTVSYPDNPKIIAVLRSYFKHRRTDCCKCGENCRGNSCVNYFSIKQTRVFSYRFVEDPAMQNRETYFLAKTDGEPDERREIYYWLYDEAGRYGYLPAGFESLGGYAYKNGKKEWLHVGGGHSYHEPEFLHSPNYEIAIKVRFHKVFQTHPETIDYLKKRFPNIFIRDWGICSWCDIDGCRNRFEPEDGGISYNLCGKPLDLYFHDPDFDDVKLICELYKSENNINPL